MIKKRLLVFSIGVILVALLVIVGVFIRGPHTFVLDMTPSGGPPSNSPSPSQPMGTTGGPWPSGSQTPSPTMSFSMPPSPSGSPTPSMSTSPTPGGGPYDILSEGDLDVEVSGEHGVIHVKWHTTSPMTGVKTIYLGVRGGYPSFSFQIDLAQGSGEYDISGPISGGPPGPQLTLQTGYCYVNFYFDRYSVEVDFPISLSCYEVVPPPQEKSGIFGYVYDNNDPGHPRINGAAVTLEDAGGWAVYPGTIYTNPNGEYQYTNVNPGTFFKLIVIKDGYERKEIPNITLQAGVEKNVNVGLYPQAPPKDKFTLAANIYDTQSQGFASDVEVRLESDEWTGYAWSAVSSGANIDPTKYGNTNLIMKNIPINKDGVNVYHFTGTAEGPNHKKTTFDFSVDKDDLTFDYNADAYVVHKDIPITPKSRLDIKCKVINSLTGEPIEGATVKIINESLDWEISGNTGPNGIVWFYNYPIDDDSGGIAVVHAEASYPHFKVDEKETSFHNSDAGSTYLLNFSLIPIQGQYVYGRIIDKDTKKPINGARVQIIKNDQFTGKEGTTNQYGRYYIENPGSGTMIVRALHLDYYDDFASRKEITLATGEDKEVNFRLRKLTSPVNTFDLTINHVYKLVNGQQVLIGDQDAVEVLISSGAERIGVKRYIYGDRVAHLGPRVPFHIFYRLPIKRVFVEAKIFNPSDNDPGWVLGYRGIVEIIQTTSDPRTIDLVLEPVLTPPDYSGGAILRGTTYLFQDPCQEYLDQIPFINMSASKVPAPKGIPVYLYQLHDHINPVQTTKTDIYGQFEFTGLIPGIYDVKVESVNYLGWLEDAAVTGRDNVKNYSIVLAGKGTGLTKTRHYGNVKVQFIGFGSHSYIGKFDWKNETNKLETIYNQTSGELFGIPKIYVIESDTYTGAFISDICGMRIVLTTKLLQDLLDSNQPLSYVLVHEYAHKFFVFGGKVGGHFATIFHAAEDTAPCSFSRITDSNIELSQLYAGHPQDSVSEYFASFFTAYFLHHDRLLDTIRNNTTGQCKYTLAYTWQWFAENVGEVYTNDNEVFHPLNGGLNGINYTKAQIKNGDWIDPAYR
jgi:hypothetical protein